MKEESILAIETQLRDSLHKMAVALEKGERVEIRVLKDGVRVNSIRSTKI